MSDRLTSLDASFLYLEESTTSMHVGSVMVFQPPREGFDYDQLVRIIESRIGAIPRFRQKVRDVPGTHRQPRLGRRRGLRPGLPRASGRPAASGQRPAAAGLRRPRPAAQARPHPAAVGGLPRRGPARRPLRHRHEDAPRAHRRRQRPRHRPRHRRRRQGRGARRRRGAVGAEPVAVVGRARHAVPSSTRCGARRRSSTSCAAVSTTPSTSACVPPSRPVRCSRRSRARPRARHPTRPSTPRSARPAGGS